MNETVTIRLRRAHTLAVEACESLSKVLRERACLWESQEDLERAAALACTGRELACLDPVLSCPTEADAERFLSAVREFASQLDPAAACEQARACLPPAQPPSSSRSPARLMLGLGRWGCACLARGWPADAAADARETMGLALSSGPTGAMPVRPNLDALDLVECARNSQAANEAPFRATLNDLRRPYAYQSHCTKTEGRALIRLARQELTARLNALADALAGKAEAEGLLVEAVASADDEIGLAVSALLGEVESWARTRNLKTRVLAHVLVPAGRQPCRPGVASRGPREALSLLANAGTADEVSVVWHATIARAGWTDEDARRHVDWLLWSEEADLLRVLLAGLQEVASIRPLFCCTGIAARDPWDGTAIEMGHASSPSPEGRHPVECGLGDLYMAAAPHGLQPEWLTGDTRPELTWARTSDPSAQLRLPSLWRVTTCGAEDREIVARIAFNLPLSAFSSGSPGAAS